MESGSSQSMGPQGPVRTGNIVNSIGVAVGGGTVNVEYNERWRPSSPREAPGLPPYYLARPEVVEPMFRGLTSGNQGIFALSGPAGVGKTTMAAGLASQLGAHFTDGVLWNQYRGRSGEAYDLIGGCLARLGGDPRQLHSFEDYGPALRTLLAGRCCLLVLDNWYDRTLDPRELLPATGSSCLLLTTEDKYLAADSSDEGINLPPLAVEAARRLLHDVAGESLSVLTDETMDRLVRLTAGMPSLIVNVGRQARREYRNGEGQLRIWAEQLQADAATPETLYEFSLSRLGERALRVFETMGVLATVPVDPLLVATTLKLEKDEVAEALRQLEGVSLVDAAKDGTFMIPATVYKYARSRWQAQDNPRRLLEDLADAIRSQIYGRPGVIPDALLAHAEAVLAGCVEKEAWSTARRVASLGIYPYQMTGTLQVWYGSDNFLVQFSSVNCVSAAIASSRLAAAQWNSCNFASSSLTAIASPAAQFNSCNFSNSSLTTDSLPGAEFNDCNFSGTTLYGVDLRGATFNDCRFAAARFLKCDMRNCVFRASTISNCMFVDCVGLELSPGSLGHPMENPQQAGHDLAR